jgi:hypothetical protein
MVLVLVLAGFVLGSACQANSVGTAESTEPLVSTEGEIEMTPSTLDPVLQTLLDQAIADLTQRLAITADQIVLVEARSVTWPDSSLGCPQEGMAYTQVLTPGYLIRLQAGDQEFEYHASSGTTVVYCENPLPPVEGTPENT